MWDTKAVAERLGVSQATVERWRRKGEGPDFVKFGDGPTAPVRYREEDVEAYVESRRVTAEGGGAAA